ncbi:MAG: uracil-DNA glycosylase [Acidobacteria bacterium]|nr:uracil-DNA glycosylase [Acidobacteriota bacterium]
MSDLAEHLRFFGELGVIGISRDRAWRERPNEAETARRAEASRHASAAAAPEAPPASADHALPWTNASAPIALRPGGIRVETLDDIRSEIGPDCSRCKLHTLGRRQVVFGVGNPSADLMFVGEGPGEEEDKQGEPFVGRAGQLLTKIIEAIGLKRQDVYIANVIKCRPPGNRNPEPDEVACCEPFLFRQVDVIRPKVIVSLGKFAAQSLLKTTDPITRLRGRVYQYRGAQLIPTFHPAYLLRNPSAKREVWEDMKKVRAILHDE